MMIQQNLYRDRYEVSVKRILDIGQIRVDLQLIYMLRMHWPFLSLVSIKPITTTTTTNFKSKQSD